MTEKNICYYQNYNMCTCRYSKFCDNACGGRDACGHYISEDDFFKGTMDGTYKEGPTAEEARAEQARIRRALTPGKSKKQAKREAKLEAEKNRITGTGGFSLGDDPAFRDLFKKK